jgi:calcineurin-like phosphoesterase family protein
MFDHFYSDPHYGHVNIIRLAKRPFDNVEEHDQELARRYNETVGPDDTTLWLGDCFWYSGRDPERASRLLDSLNGRKALVIGNHDGPAFNMADLGFEFVVPRLHMKIADREVVVCHYPDEGGLIRPWDDKYKHLAPRLAPGRLVMHGHTHVS